MQYYKYFINQDVFLSDFFTSKIDFEKKRQDVFMQTFENKVIITASTLLKDGKMGLMDKCDAFFIP